MKKVTCPSCKQSMEAFSAFPENSQSSDVFEWEPCSDCGNGCRLIAIIDGTERIYRCCHCAAPLGPEQP